MDWGRDLSGVHLLISLSGQGSCFDVFKHVLPSGIILRLHRFPMVRLPLLEIRAISTTAYTAVGTRNLSIWLVKQNDQPCYILVVSYMDGL